MKIIFLDTETTGIEAHDRICQIAFKVDGEGTGLKRLFKPEVPITTDASSINHITNKMVEHEESFIGSRTHAFLKEKLEGDSIMVAHNAKFDFKMLQKENIHPKNIICTLKLVHHLDEKAEMTKYNLQYLRYHYGFDLQATAHDALGDVDVLEKLFHFLKPKFSSVEEMISISNKPILYKKLPFGKHKNVHLSSVPTDYLGWMLREMSLDEDMLYSINYWINNKLK